MITGYEDNLGSLFRERKKSVPLLMVKKLETLTFSLHFTRDPEAAKWSHLDLSTVYGASDALQKRSQGIARTT